MIRFLDGPAAGVNLVLRRAPIMLRVVRSAAGEWDALDQLDDEPAAGEAVYVYRLQGDAGWMHIDYRDKAGRRRGETRMTGDYRYVEAQPGDQHTLTNAAWVAWCDANKDRILAERAAAVPANG